MKIKRNNILSNKWFEIILFLFIFISVLIVLIDSVDSLSIEYSGQIYFIEIICSTFFTIEYLYRIFTSNQKLKYIFSFFGIIDLISIIPFYIGFFDIDATSVSVLRSIRFIRIFRILKLAKFLGEENLLIKAVKQNINKITVFLLFICVVLVIFGSTMYVIEGEKSGFTSIPKSIYWAVVTMTTVGYGDIAPQTILGQFISSIIMLLGYGIIAVPTGIVINDIRERKVNCKACQYPKNLIEYKYCGKCGEQL